MSFVVNMVLERDTKGAVRYQEVDEKGGNKDIAQGARIGTLYIRKSAFDGKPIPKAIEVTINELD